MNIQDQVVYSVDKGASYHTRANLAFRNETLYLQPSLPFVSMCDSSGRTVSSCCAAWWKTGMISDPSGKKKEKRAVPLAVVDLDTEIKVHDFTFKLEGSHVACSVGRHTNGY
jgi:hypothetical protein